MSPLLLGSIVLGLIQDPAPPAEPAGPAFQTILWLHGGPERDVEFFRAVAELGFTAVSVAAGEDPAVPGQYGLGFYLDQVAGKGVLELRDAQWQPVRDMYEEGRQAGLLTRPACLSDPAVVGQLVRAVRIRLEEAAPYEPLAASLGDEISLTRHANPLDLCFGPDCLRGFRDELRRRYGTVAALNKAWQTSFPEFESVFPFTADQIRRRELGNAYLPANLRPWAEHREFMDAVVGRTVGDLVAHVRAVAPGLPVGLTGMQPPSAYGGHDYRRLVPELSFFEAYDIGGARDLAMSLAPTGARQILTVFPPTGDEPRDMVKGHLADALAHGMWGAVVWSAGDVFTDGLRPTPFGASVRGALRDLASAGAAFAGAELEFGPVWIVDSQASVRAWWMLDSAADGPTWIRRLSSYEARHSTSLAARSSWVKLCQDLGVQPRLVPEEELSRRLLRDRPGLLVLPACIAMSDDAVRAVRSFLAQGGVVVADHTPALYDETLRMRPRPALDELFGISHRTLRWEDLLVREGMAGGLRLPTGAAVAERGLVAELGEPFADQLVQIEKGHGRGGRAYCLNLVVSEYGSVRLDPAAAPTATAVDLRRRLRHVFERAGVKAPVAVTAASGGGLPALVERVVLRGRGDRRLLALRLNILESPSLVRTLQRRGAQHVRLVFPAEVHPLDLRRHSDLGVGTTFEVDLDPIAGLFLELRRQR